MKRILKDGESCRLRQEMVAPVGAAVFFSAVAACFLPAGRSRRPVKQVVLRASARTGRVSASVVGAIAPHSKTRPPTCRRLGR